MRFEAKLVVNFKFIKMGKWIELLIVLIMMAVFVLLLMLLWNWLMPTIFGLIKINFWKALGLIILCRILFKPWNVTE